MQTQKIAYVILLILTVIVLGIYLYQNNNVKYENHTKHEKFNDLLNTNINTNITTAPTMSSLQPIINMPDVDIHFIMDKNPVLITSPILNYKLKITNSDGISSNKYISVFMHQSYQYNNTTYTPLGQYVHVSDELLDLKQSTVMDNIMKKQCITYVSASIYYPVDYNLIWTSDINSDGTIFSVWRPIPPSGFMVLGDVIVNGTSKPVKEYITCLPITMLEFAGISNGILWHSINDMGKDCYCWGSGNFDTFRATNEYNPKIPELKMVYNLTQKALENNTLNTKPTIPAGNGLQV